MVHSKTSYNHEGFGYNKNSPSSRDPKSNVPSKKTSLTSPLKCSYCNKLGHTVQYCKFKNGEIKGKHVWVRKDSRQYNNNNKRVPYNNMFNNDQRQQRPQQNTMFQNRNTHNHVNRALRNYQLPNKNVYHQNASYYDNNRNAAYNSQSRFHRLVRSHDRYNASRNLYMPNNHYPMPRLLHANSYVNYDVLTQGPSRQRGTYKFN